MFKNKEEVPDLKLGHVSLTTLRLRVNLWCSD